MASKDTESVLKLMKDNGATSRFKIYRCSWHMATCCITNI